jgi:hypothetical protein
VLIALMRALVPVLVLGGAVCTRGGAGGGGGRGGGARRSRSRCSGRGLGEALGACYMEERSQGLVALAMAARRPCGSG